LILKRESIQRLLFFANGVASFPGQLGLAFGARFETAARISLYRESFELLFSFVFQIVFFEVTISKVVISLQP